MTDEEIVGAIRGEREQRPPRADLPRPLGGVGIGLGGNIPPLWQPHQPPWMPTTPKTSITYSATTLVPSNA